MRDENDFAVNVHRFNSIDHPIESSLTVIDEAGTLSTHTLSRAYDDTGALVAQIYPGGRRIERDRDDLLRDDDDSPRR